MGDNCPWNCSLGRQTYSSTPSKLEPECRALGQALRVGVNQGGLRTTVFFCVKGLVKLMFLTASKMFNLLKKLNGTDPLLPTAENVIY